MTTTKHVLGSGNFSQNWSNTGQITTNDNWSGVPSIVGYLGQDITTATGTNPQTLTTDSTVANDVDVIANQTNTTLNSGGVAEFQLADPVVALQGSGTADAPHLIIYLDATGRENITFSFRARDIDGGISPGGNTDDAIQPIAVQYRVGGSGPWINIPAAFIADATTGPNTLGPDTLVNVTLPAGANGASDLQIRVITTNAVGNDEWVGIDDIGVSSTAIPPGPGILSIADASVTEGNAGTVPISFTVSRSAGADGAVSVNYNVTLGGTATNDFGAGQTFSGTLNWAAGDAAPKTITLQVQGDTTVEPNEQFTVTLSGVTGGASISDATATGTITNDDSGPVPIHDIQGATHTSPWVGASVTTNGIVTAVDSNGFYIQDPNPDANDATSEGVFVFTSSAPTVAIGNAVTVTGTVAEFVASATSLGVTEITSPVIVVNSTGNALPAATLIGTGGRLPPTENYEDDNFTSFDPATDGLDFYESMEGMRVTIQAPLVVSNTNSFGETYVVASGGAGATGINARQGITLSDGDFNPERIQIDNDANLSPAGYNPSYTQGDVLGNVTGILNYAVSSYEVLVTDPVSVTTDVTLGRETTALDGDSTHLTVVSFNVENLDPTDPQSKFDTIASEIVNNLSAPDIVGLQEIQDADGAGSGSDLSGQATADKLIAAIVAAGGPTYQYVEVAPTVANSTGGEGNGNIRNGYLYNPARVTYVPGSAELVEDPAYSGTRRPLAADFTFNGETVTVINVHFTSRGGSDPLMGDTQPPANAGESARLAQAQALRTYIDALAAGDPELNIVTLGDFNSYYFESALQALQAGGAMNNLFYLLPEEERYSYMFEGNLQPFDNILVSPNLALSSQFDVVHENAEQLAANQPTDHDQALALILISANDTLYDSSGNDVRRSGAGNDFFYLTQGGNDTASGGDGNDVFFFGGAMTSADQVDGGNGTDQVALQGDYSGGLTFGTGVINIENIGILPGNDTRFGDPGTNSYDYVITMVDENVAPGVQMVIDANRLRVGEDFTFNGSAENNGSFFIYGGGGTDNLTGGLMNDVFLFGAQGQWGASDVVNGGPGGTDQLSLRGDYTIVFGATQLIGIENIGMVSAFDTRFGALGSDYDYDLTMNDGNVANGVQMTVDAATLRLGETLTFNGSQESNGSFRVFGGDDTDTIIGSQNADILVGRGSVDTLTGGTGNDVFRYNAVADSLPNARDVITDFTSGDQIDLSRIDANTQLAGDQAFNFIGSDAFSNTAGELRFEFVSGQTWLIQGDTDGIGGADFEITVTIPDSHPITSGDFIP